MNSPYFLDCAQRSKEWFDARLGCVTSSRIADVVAKRKRKTKEGEKEEELACRRDMRWELIVELLTKCPHPNWVSRWMDEGTEKEPLARANYEVRNGVSVEEVGFACHPTIKMAGASPDGVIGEIGLLEIKCPRMVTHLKYLRDDKIPDQYLPQLVWQLACVPDFEWVDFVSYYCPLPSDDPRFAIDLPRDLAYFQKRMYRTTEVNDVIAAYEREVEVFNEEVQREYLELQGRIREAVAA